MDAKVGSQQDQQNHFQSNGIAEKVLEELTLEGVAKHIKKLQAFDNRRKILVLTGAGISTAAGINDFRTPGTGLYDNLAKYKFTHPKKIYDLDHFSRYPKPCFHLTKDLYEVSTLCKPTIAHYFIRLLAEEGLLLRNYTQNVDSLELLAGVDEEFMVEAHRGLRHSGHCITCNKLYSPEYVMEHIFREGLVMCTEPNCAQYPQEEGEPYKGVVQPGILFTDEPMPERFTQLSGEDTAKCELVIIMGTSLYVHPYSTLLDTVPDCCPRLLINLVKTGQKEPVVKVLDFGTSSYRDVFLQTKCDEGCLKLAKLLGLDEKLLAMYKSGNEKLDSIIEENKSVLERLQKVGK